jgi:hypothetical protein
LFFVVGGGGCFVVVVVVVVVFLAILINLAVTQHINLRKILNFY